MKVLPARFAVGAQTITRQILTRNSPESQASETERQSQIRSLVPAGRVPGKDADQIYFEWGEKIYMMV